jgi:hypothetical protein
MPMISTLGTHELNRLGLSTLPEIGVDMLVLVQAVVVTPNLYPG